MIPDAPTISLPHAANMQKKPAAASSVNDAGSNLHTQSSVIDNVQSKIFGENKWMKMSKDIKHSIKPISTNMPSELSDNLSSKWARMSDEIISSTSAMTKSNRTSKRMRSPNVNNKWMEQRKKILKENK